MVDARAGKDDDAFLAFTFPPAINGPQSSTSPKSDDDDDWGDFVESPLRSDLLNKTPLWDKPKGALPLSLFGYDNADDDVARSGDPTESQVKGGIGYNLSLNSDGINSNGLRELSLDNQNRINGGNGFNFSLNYDGIGLDLNRKDLKFDLFGGKDPNASGLGANSDLFSDFRSLDNRDLSGLSSNNNMSAVNNVVGVPQVKNLSGVSSKSDIFAKSGDFKNLEKGNVSGLSSNIDMFSVNNEVQSPQLKDFSGLSFGSELFAAKNGNLSPQVKGLSGLSVGSDVFAVRNDRSPQVKDTIVSNVNSDAFSHIKSGYSQTAVTSELNLGADLFVGNNGNNRIGLDSNLNGSYSNTDHPNGNEEVESDEDSWEFKDAYSEMKVDKGNNDKVNSKQQENSEASGISFQAYNGSHESIEFSSASNGDNVKPKEMDFSFGFTQSAVTQNVFDSVKTVAQNDLRSDSFFNSDQSSFNGELNSDPLDSDEWFGNFQGAFTENGLKEENVAEMDNASHSEVEVLTSDGKAQGIETRTNNHKGALPLALFGDEELETDDSSNALDDFAYKPSSTQTGGINNEGSKYSIHDVLSNLYSKAQQNSPVENLEKLTGNGLNLNHSDEVLSHTPENFEEDFDDGSWEFKFASARTHTFELSNHVNFYTRLKEELSFICRCHIENLKKARDTAASFGEDAKVVTIEKEIQEACKELQEENINFEVHSDDQKLREICLNEFLEVLHEPKFQVLESQYQLSRILHLAQKDLTSAIEAMKHTKSKLNILTIGSSEDQYNYVSTWHKIISVCAQEMKHGSWIWKQSIEKNLQIRMLSESRGKDFVISLGEIYRVLTILRASIKFYEPWILSNYINSAGIFSLLEDCETLWSSLKIEEALEALPVNDEYQSMAKLLLESIKHLHNLDELKLRDLVLNQQVSMCRLSLLPTEVIPDMKMVTWGGETYFVTLVNIWVNLISCDPLELPSLQVA